jgi:hypothetical protein
MSLRVISPPIWLRRAGEHLQQALRHTGAVASTAKASALRRQLGRLHDHGATRGQRRAGFARDHRGGEVPRRDGGVTPDGLLDCQDAAVAGAAQDLSPSMRGLRRRTTR